MDKWGQRQATVRLDWGTAGAAAISQGADYAVVVDILSFCTSVSVALDGGAEVFPYRWRDATAVRFARQHDAVLAVGRPEAGTTRRLEVGASGRLDHPQVSLSPASIRSAPGLRRLVLPSPNGSALSARLADGPATVLAASFRNRTAIARWLASQPADNNGCPPVIAIVAAGEHWPDGTLRPAVEDYWGAGAVAAGLSALGLTGLSPEAATAAAAFAAMSPQLSAQLTLTASGQELTGTGFGADVAIAAELDASATVPLLTDGRYSDMARFTGGQADLPARRA